MIINQTGRRKGTESRVNGTNGRAGGRANCHCLCLFFVTVLVITNSVLYYEYVRVQSIKMPAEVVVSDDNLQTSKVESVIYLVISCTRHGNFTSFPRFLLKPYTVQKLKLRFSMFGKVERPSSIQISIDAGNIPKPFKTIPHTTNRN